MSGQELLWTLNDTMRQAVEANEEARRAAVEAAKARADYKAVKAVQVAALRGEKYPVSLIGDLVWADAALREAYIRAETADAEYQSLRETVLLRKREADILRDQLSREWSTAGMPV